MELDEGTNQGRRSLRANFSWTAIGNLIYAACQWAIVACFTKFGTAQLVGQFGIALAISTPIALMFQMQLRSIQATDVRRAYDFSEYLSFRLVTTVIAVLSTIGLLVLGRFENSTALIIALVALGKSFDSIADVIYGAFQQREQMDVIARATILNGVLSFLFAAGGIWISKSLIVATAGYVAGSALPLVVYIIPKANMLFESDQRFFRNLQWNRDRLKAILRLSLPLGIVTLLISLSWHMPRYFIEYRLGEYQLGIYTALSYFTVAGSTVVNALGQAVTPSLARHLAFGELTQARRKVIWLIVFGLSIGVVGYVISVTIGNVVIRILYTGEYAEYSNILAILALSAGVGFGASFAGYGLTSAREFDAQVPIFSLVLVTSVISSFFLIGEFGLLGAAVSVGVTQGVNLLACGIALSSRLRVQGSCEPV